jgi:hypothetical protein
MSPVNLEVVRKKSARAPRRPLGKRRGLQCTLTVEIYSQEERKA